MTRLLSVAFVCGLFPWVARADVSPDPASLVVPPEEHSRAETLVRELAHPAYPVRAEAMRTLRQMGRLALEAIGDAVGTDPDPEVRFRCELLLPAAEADDFAARMASFVSDTQGRYDHELPGWDEFRELAGGDTKSRQLFTQLLASEPNRAILAGFGRSDEEIAGRLAERMAELQQLMYPRFRPPGFKKYVPTVEDATTVLFAEVVLGENVQTAPGVSSTTLVSQTSFRQAFSDADTGPALTRIVRPWLDSRPGPNGPVTAMNVAKTLQLADYPRYIGRVLESEDLSPSVRANAMSYLARIGGVEHIAKLTPLFKDEAVVRRQANKEDIQLRDSALAMSMVLAGKDPKDLGFEAQNSRATSQYYYWNFRFPSDEARTKGFAKWKEIAKTLPEK